MGGGNHQQRLVPLAQGDIQPGRRGAEGGHPGDDLNGVAPGPDDLVNIHVCRIDGGIPQGDEGHLLAVLNVVDNPLGGIGIGLGKHLLVPGHGGGDQNGGLAV